MTNSAEKPSLPSHCDHKQETCASTLSVLSLTQKTSVTEGQSDNKSDAFALSEMKSSEKWISGTSYLLKIEFYFILKTLLTTDITTICRVKKHKL